MKLRRLLIAVLVSGLILLFEFKVLPYLIDKVKSWNKQNYQPIQETEIVKGRLVTVLKEKDIKILSGPITRPEIDGIEVVIKHKGLPMKIIFSTIRAPRNQLASLQLILKEAKIEEKLEEGIAPQLIDLTGEKPYVSF